MPYKSSADWKFDGIDTNLNCEEQYNEMMKRRWTCAACGLVDLQHVPNAAGGDTNELQAFFLEDGTPVCRRCMNPVFYAKSQLKAKIRKRNPRYTG